MKADGKNLLCFSFQLCHDAKLSKSLEKMNAFAQAGTRTLHFFTAARHKRHVPEVLN